MILLSLLLACAPSNGDKGKSPIERHGTTGSPDDTLVVTDTGTPDTDTTTTTTTTTTDTATTDTATTDTATTDTEPVVPLDPIVPSITFDHPSPTVATVSWETEDGDHWVEFGPGLKYRTETIHGADPSFDLMGMPAGRTWDVKAYTVLDDRQAESERLSVDIPSVPDAVPSFRVQIDNGGSEAAEGWILTTWFNRSEAFVFIINGSGKVVWSLPVPVGVTPAWPAIGRDGSSILYAMIDDERWDPWSSISRLAHDGSVIETLPALTMHHSFAELPDSSFAWLGLKTLTMDVPLLGTRTILGDDIRWNPADGSRWRYPEILADFMSNDMDFFIPCSHFFRRIDMYGAIDANEWTHGNSMTYNEELDAFFVGHRLHDAVIKVDHRTREKQWQMGGIHSDFTMEESDEYWWSHGHFSEFWGDGFLMYDNRSHMPDATTRVTEYTYDEEARTVSRKWTYYHPDGMHLATLGDVRALPGGNRLVMWNGSGLITEHTADGELVWQASTIAGGVMGRMIFIPDIQALVPTP